MPLVILCHKQRSALTLEEFKEAVQMKDAVGNALLFEWLQLLSQKIGAGEDSNILELEKKYNPVIIRHRISESTKFSINEVAALEKQFHKIFNSKGSYRVTVDQFIETLQMGLRNTLKMHQNCRTHQELSIDKRWFEEGGFVERIARRENTHAGSAVVIAFDAFCRASSHLCRGDFKSKLHYFFQLYKENPQQDQGSQVEEWIGLSGIEKLLEFARTCDCFEREADENSEKVPSAYDKSQDQDHILKAKALLVEEQQPKEDGAPQQHSGLKWESFLKWAGQCPLLLEAVDTVGFVLCLVFGIKPDSNILEKRLIEWYWKTATELKVGQTWYLVGSKWWTTWCRHVQMDVRNGTPQGLLPLPPLPSEVRVLEDSEVEECIVSNFPRPGPIANWSLLKRSGSRRLKEKLALGKDFHVSILICFHSGYFLMANACRCYLALAASYGGLYSAALMV
jgi:hypothetical protein